MAATPTAAMIIRTGHASIEVDSLDRALRALERTTRLIGGGVGNTTMLRGEDEVRRATIELRVASARYDSALGGLAATVRRGCRTRLRSNGSFQGSVLSPALIASLGVLVPVTVVLMPAAWWMRRRAQRLLGNLGADQHA